MSESPARQSQRPRKRRSIGNDFVSPVLVEDEVLDSSGLVSAEDLVLSSLVDMGHAPKRRCTTASPSAAAVDDLPPPPIPLHATPLAATASGNQHRNMSNVASMSPKQSSSSPMQTRSPVTGAVRSFLPGSPNTATGSGYVTPAMLYPGTQVQLWPNQTEVEHLMGVSGTLLQAVVLGSEPPAAAHVKLDAPWHNETVQVLSTEIHVVRKPSWKSPQEIGWPVARVKSGDLGVVMSSPWSQQRLWVKCQQCRERFCFESAEHPSKVLGWRRGKHVFICSTRCQATYRTSRSQSELPVDGASSTQKSGVPWVHVRDDATLKSDHLPLVGTDKSPLRETHVQVLQSSLKVNHCVLVAAMAGTLQPAVIRNVVFDQGGHAMFYLASLELPSGLIDELTGIWKSGQLQMVPSEDASARMGSLLEKHKCSLANSVCEALIEEPVHLGQIVASLPGERLVHQTLRDALRTHQIAEAAKKSKKRSATSPKLGTWLRSRKVLRHRVAQQSDDTSTLLQDLVRWVVFKESRRKLKASAPRISQHQATRVAMEDAFKNFIMMYQHRLEKAFTQIGHKPDLLWKVWNELPVECRLGFVSARWFPKEQPRPRPEKRKRRETTTTPVAIRLSQLFPGRKCGVAMVDVCSLNMNRFASFPPCDAHRCQRDSRCRKRAGHQGRCRLNYSDTKPKPRAKKSQGRKKNPAEQLDPDFVPTIPPEVQQAVNAVAEKEPGHLAIVTGSGTSTTSILWPPLPVDSSVTEAMEAVEAFQNTERALHAEAHASALGVIGWDQKDARSRALEAQRHAAKLLAQVQA